MTEQQSNFNLLIVDDSSFFRSAMKNELDDQGYELDFAQNGQEALESVENNEYDLVVLDLELPDINGFEVCKRIKTMDSGNTKSNVPIIFLTARDTVENRKTGFELGAIDFMGKSSLGGNISAAINKILRPGSTCAGMNVLILDDSVVVRSIIKGLLNDEGMHIYEAEGAKEAYDILTDNLNIDFMIIDKELPESDGLEVVKNIRKNYPNRQVPILVVSASPVKDVSIDFFNAGASDYLPKPFIKEEFLARVRNKLDIYRMDKTLRGNSDRLKELNEFKDRFLSQCSNDMKHPLNNINLSLHLLEKKGSLNEDQKKVVKFIKSASTKLDRLINGILDLRTIELNAEYEMKDIDLKAAIESAVAKVTPTAQERNIQFKVELPQRDFMIKGDLFAVKRVFENLLLNAIQHSSNDSEVELRSVLIRGNCVVTIKDTGEGMPVETLKRLFEKDIINDSVTDDEGLSLGLLICRSICEKHGAKISAESELGQGTTFTTTWSVH